MIKYSWSKQCINNRLMAASSSEDLLTLAQLGGDVNFRDTQ